MQHLKYLNKFFIKYKFLFFSGLIAVVISNIFGVMYPPVFRYSIDLITESIYIFNIFHNTDLQNKVYGLFTHYLLIFGLVVLLLNILKGFFLYLMRQTLIVMSREVEYDLKNELYNKYQELSMGFFRRNKTGDLMARISEDVGKVRMYVGPGVMYASNMVVMLVFTIYTMLRVNAELTLYVLAPLPLLSVAVFYVNNIILRRSKKIQEQLATLTSFSQEAYSGIRVIKTYGRESAFNQLFADEVATFKQKTLRMVKVDAVFFPLIMGLMGLSTILTVYVGGIKLSEGTVSAGNIAEFVIYVNLLAWPVTSVGWVASMIQQAAASQVRINEFLNTKPEIDKNIGEIIDLQGNVCFKNVSFTYPDSGIEALKNIDFTLTKGKTIGIVGKTGSGKSTIAALLTRLYDVTNGEISLDNHNINTLNPANLRAQMGYVPQDVFLFSDTIAHNIAFGTSDFDINKIHTAAQQAAVYDNIMGFNDKFDTLLGERGVTLSGGQKQRVAIARAIIRRPKIFIFDDCLGALDTNTENEVLTNLQKISADVSTVIISHRISSVMHADHIIVLNDGKIAEQGTHAQLIGTAGYYQSVFEKQQVEAQIV
jgi:ATP-binding cassette subfamily B protein